MALSYDSKTFSRKNGDLGDRLPSVGFQRSRSIYTATGGETTMNLASAVPPISYIPGRAQVSIKRSSGGNPISGVDFVETDANTITFPAEDPLLPGEKVEITKEFSITGIMGADSSVPVAYLQEAFQYGTQSFVNNTSLISVPYTTIVNRAKIPDIANDLRVSYGVERVMTQGVYEIADEVGPAGQIVKGILGDDKGLVRACGAWNIALNSLAGPFLNSSVVDDFIEIVFKGVGLNVLTYTDANTGDFRVTIDGGAESSNLYTTGSAVLSGLGHAKNTVVNVASGLSSGIHTARIRIGASTTNGFLLYGYEVIEASSSTLTVNPGTGYLGGQKYQLASAVTPTHSSSFETGSLGSRGGRAIAYLKSDGTIGKAVAVNTSSQTYSSADHTNEEVTRVYNYREFGANNISNGFNALGTSIVDKYFTLDDGVTTLAGRNVQTYGVSPDAFGTCLSGGNNGNIYFTFVGVGLDLVLAIDNNTRSFTSVEVDGSSIGSLSKSASTQKEIRKIVSGLPYGTHTIRFINTSATTSPGIVSFIVYGPKTPTTTEVLLSSYNILPSYTQNGTSGADVEPSAGAIPKYALREWYYNGTWSTTAMPTHTGGVRLDTSTNSNYAELSFVGSGIELTVTCVTSATATIQLDGSAYTGSATTGASTWTAGTSTWSSLQTSPSVSSLAITGLTPGPHKIRITKASGTTLGLIKGAVITTLYSPKRTNRYGLQNTLAVGSSSLIDHRNMSMIKELTPFPSIKSNQGATTSLTTSVTSFIPMGDMMVPFESSGGWFLLGYHAWISNSSTSDYTQTRMKLNGEDIGIISSFGNPSGGNTAQGTVGSSIPVYLPKGTYFLQVWWTISGGTTTAQGFNRVVYALPLYK